MSNQSNLEIVQKVPLILNIETSTDVCSVCLSKGEQILNLQASEEVFEHSKILTTLIERCSSTVGISLQEIDAVAISSGPGSYTSLRVGTSTAKGICYALDKPLISVNTLQALALATKNELNLPGALYCPMIDARRMEVYCALFDDANNPVTESTAMVIEPNSFNELFASEKRIIFSGNGAEKCQPVLTSEHAVFHSMTCSAKHLPPLSNLYFETGKFVDTAYFTPHYLKPPNITTPKRMSVLDKVKKS